MNICLLHDLHTGQDVMYKDVTNQWCYQTTITSLCTQPRSYNITAYRKTQSHLKPYQPQCKKTEDEHFDNDMQTLKASCKQFDSITSKNNQVQSHSRPNRDTKPPVNLDL